MGCGIQIKWPCFSIVKLHILLASALMDWSNGYLGPAFGSYPKYSRFKILPAILGCILAKVKTFIKLNSRCGSCAMCFMPIEINWTFKFN